MNLTHRELSGLMDKGHTIYEIWKAPMPVHSGSDYYTDPVLQIQAYSDTNRLPLKVTKKFAPIKKLKANPGIHRWSYGAGYSESSDIEMLLTIFKMAGYPVVMTEEHKSPFGGHYTLYYVANIGGKS